MRTTPVDGSGSKRSLLNGGLRRAVLNAKSRTGEKLMGGRGVWQPKFWEHTIEEEEDFETHFDYIHFNPVKHGHVRCPVDWKWSSFHRWVRAGVYPKNWACGNRDEVPTFDHIKKTVGE